MKKEKSNFYFMSDEEILARASAVDSPRKEIINSALNTLGEISTMSEICGFFKISRSHIYRGIDERKVLTIKSGTKLLILTKTIANILKNNEL